MANTIAFATGHDKNRVKEAHRLGSETAEVEAATWHTHVRAWVNKDGSGRVTVTQNGRTLYYFEWGPENAG